MKKITYLLLITMSLFVFNSCDDDAEGGTQDLNYLSFESTTYNFGVELNGSTTLDIALYSTKATSAARTYNVNVVTEDSSADPACYTIPTSITIPANSNVGLLNVTVADLNISEEGETLVLTIEGKDGLFTGENITLNLKQTCPLNEVFLDITFDSYPEETAWELLDSSNNVIASGDGTAAAKKSSIAKSFCLEDGTYTFNITDVYADGITPPGNWKLTYNGSVIGTGDEFGASDTLTFDVSK